MSVHEKMNAIADAIRRKTGGTELLSLDQMAIEIDGITAGGSMFTSTAVGIISSTLNGRANSVFTIDFESSMDCYVQNIQKSYVNSTFTAPGFETSVSSSIPNVQKSYANVAFIVPGFETSASSNTQFTFCDMNVWEKNSSAAGAYQNIDYDESSGENVCTYLGTGGHELIGFRVIIPAGKTIEFSFDYYNPNTISFLYEEPYAPFMGVFNKSRLSYSDGHYAGAIAVTVMDTAPTSEYVTYSCQYTNPYSSSDYEVLLGFVTGCMEDGISQQFKIRDVKVKMA